MVENGGYDADEKYTNDHLCHQTVYVSLFPHMSVSVECVVGGVIHGDGSYIKKNRPSFPKSGYFIKEFMCTFDSEQTFVVRSYAQLFFTRFFYNYSELRDLRQTSVKVPLYGTNVS